MIRARKRGSRNGASRSAATNRDLSPVALIGSGPHGEITSWNRAATTLLGWQADDVVGRRLHEVLGCGDVVRLDADSHGTQVHASVSSDDGCRIEVELLVGRDSHLRPNPGDLVVAVVPVGKKTRTVEGARSPRIDGWVEAAQVISGIGGTVQCVAIGLVGIEAINKGYSRSTGDAVLREVAGRLERSVGLNGKVLRVAGNQFMVVVAADVELDAAELVAIVSQSVDTQLGRVRIGCYAGSIRGDSASGLIVLDRADSAMRSAQLRGVGAVERPAQVDAKHGQRHPRLNSLLIDAVARRDIDVTFQPVIELATGRIIEFEALARWNSSELGKVDPGAFIEAAEDVGLIHELGQIVLRRSLDVVRTEVLAGRWGSRRVSVNLSAVQLSHPHLTACVIEALSARHLDGEVLQLELTETRLLPDIAATAASLEVLRDIGVRLAIDDFGTGCANMAYLRDLPIDAIKIDGRFVDGMCASLEDTAVIRSMVSLARELRVDVIAERVESEEQHFALTRLGCFAAQGFLYSGDREPRDFYRPITLPSKVLELEFPCPHDETTRLEALYQADLLDTPGDEMYDEIVRAAAELCNMPISLISLIDQDRQWFKARVGLDIAQTGRDVSFCSHAICSEDLMEVEDAQRDERFAENPLVLGDPNVRFYAGAPLRAAAGYSYGTLCVLDTVPRTLTDEQRDGLTRLARQATASIELRESTNRLSHALSQLAAAADRERDAVDTTSRQQAQHDEQPAASRR